VEASDFAKQSLTIMVNWFKNIVNCQSYEGEILISHQKVMANKNLKN
jgi:hypothetical protein